MATEMVFFYPEGHEKHFEVGHPERPERVEAIREALQQAGDWDCYPHLTPLELPDKVLSTIHTSEYLTLLQKACQRGLHLDADTYTTPASWELALKAAGGAAAVADAVWTRQAKRGFALCRPPGHHATPRAGMGFCLLNNVALAAEYLRKTRQAQKLAIVDLDLHHGNGTQEAFYRRGDVLYISTHQFPFYPGTGSIAETGTGEGAFATCNIPLPAYSGDQAFQAAMQQVILPVLGRFQPEMLLVSVGFDTHWRDPLGYLKVSAGVYAQLIRDLTSWADEHCQGRIALFLEGGYDLDASRVCAQGVTAALLGKEFKDRLGPSPDPEPSTWQKVIQQVVDRWGLNRK